MLPMFEPWVWTDGGWWQRTLRTTRRTSEQWSRSAGYRPTWVCCECTPKNLRSVLLLLINLLLEPVNASWCGSLITLFLPRGCQFVGVQAEAQGGKELSAELVGLRLGERRGLDEKGVDRCSSAQCRPGHAGAARFC